MHPKLSSVATGLTFGLSLLLLSFFVYVSSEGSGESVQTCLEPSLLAYVTSLPISHGLAQLFFLSKNNLTNLFLSGTTDILSFGEEKERNETYVQFQV